MRVIKLIESGKQNIGVIQCKRFFFVSSTVPVYILLGHKDSESLQFIMNTVCILHFCKIKLVLPTVGCIINKEHFINNAICCYMLDAYLN